MNLTLSYRLMLSSYLLLILLLLTQTYSSAPEDSRWWEGLFIWIFKVLPLIFVVRGLIQKRHTSATWLSFLSMLYLIFGVLLAFTRGGELYGWLMSLSCLILFISSMLYTRWKKEAIASVQ